MSNEAEVTIILYVNLFPKEEKFLKAIESDVMDELLKKGFTKRPMWTSTTNVPNRFIQLCILENPPVVLFELDENEFANISKERFLAKVFSNIN